MLSHLISVFNIFPHHRLVKSESSDSLLSQTSSSSSHHHHAVPSRKQWAQRSLSGTCPPLPVPSYEAPNVTAMASSGLKRVHKSKTLRQIKESRSQKHTRVKVHFLSLWLRGKKFLYLIHLKYISKNFMKEMNGIYNLL